MKTIKSIALSILIISGSVHAGDSLPPKPFKTPLQREMDTRGFKIGMPADSLLSLVNTHSKQCSADINMAGNVVVVTSPSGELVVKISLLSKVSRKDWDAIYKAC